MAKEYGIRPWEFERLRLSEISRLQEDMNARIKSGELSSN
jgi:hypothetical protein